MIGSSTHGKIAKEIAILLGMKRANIIDSEMRTMGVTESRRKFGELLRHFKACGAPIRITNRQGASAVLISYSDYQEFMDHRLSHMTPPAERAELTSEEATQ